MEKQEFVECCRKKLHDLNNKLCTITACGSSMRSDKDIPEDVKKYIEIMTQAAKESGSIVSEIYELLKR